MSKSLVTVRLTLVLGLGVLTACSTPQDLDPTNGIYDPYEVQNRKVHAFNRELDRNIVRPAAKGYTNVLPDEVEDLVGNVASNLAEPSVMTNSLLQGDVKGLGLSTLRFVLNSTLGIVGLIDVASEFGIAEHDTDFGETLFKWGAGEGPYVELPFVGPSTQRAATGMVVDMFTNPLGYVLGDPEDAIPPVASVAAGLGARGRYSDTIDSILYESADSYAQARLIYMQNRRFKLGDQNSDAAIDPFELDTEGF
ncbi:MAG: VacJ family lipoprotein [Paracoccaceae bacterium]